MPKIYRNYIYRFNSAVRFAALRDKLLKTQKKRTTEIRLSALKTMFYLIFNVLLTSSGVPLCLAAFLLPRVFDISLCSRFKAKTPFALTIFQTISRAFRFVLRLFYFLGFLILACAAALKRKRRLPLQYFKPYHGRSALSCGFFTSSDF
ncbi:MAG: hypothetical protein NC131_00285 [Roseburia sp.]|nr:hypothetical protein [Roseburia sp.]